jgi:hypothetical protein
MHDLSAVSTAAPVSVVSGYIADQATAAVPCVLFVSYLRTMNAAAAVPLVFLVTQSWTPLAETSIPSVKAEQAAGAHGSTVLELTASTVPAHDMVDLAAGWVSVLLNLKAVINFGNDLRNHERARTWLDAFIDN